MTTDSVVRALDTELVAVLSVLDSCDTTDFDRATNCPPWTLKDLVVHLAGTTRLPADLRAGSGEVHRAADYYRRPERATQQYRQSNVDQVQRASSRYASGQDAVDALRRSRADVMTQLETEDLSRVVDVRNVGAMTLVGLLSTRVVAVAAHALDVSITLGRAATTSDGALSVCVPILVDLLGEEPSSALGWTDQAFFERGTGRTPLGDDEARTLGTAAPRFPLIS